VDKLCTSTATSAPNVRSPPLVFFLSAISLPFEKRQVAPKIERPRRAHHEAWQHQRTWRRNFEMSALPSILLQKSKVASVRIFGETLKHEAIDDSDNLSRATEVAYEFSVRG
jgi:hypothetical protein